MVKRRRARSAGSWCCVIFVCAVILGCADAANNASTPSPTITPTPAPVAQIQISITVDEQQRLCSRGQVTASLFIDGVRGENLTVDCAANQLNYNLSGTSAGPHSFNIEVSLDSILIYRVSTQATLVAGSSHTLSFSNPQFIDSDGDGFSNLSELIAFGRYSDAWQNASIRPAADLPRFTKNYVLTDQLGETFAGGSSGSATYRTSADF